MNDKDNLKEVKCTSEKYRGLCDEAKEMHVSLLGLLLENEAEITC